MSLISVLVTTTIAAIIGLALVSLLTNAFKAQKFSVMKDDIEFVRRSVGQSLKCLQTIPNPAVCDGVTPIILKDGSSQPLTTIPLVTNGPLAGSGKFGNFYVKATCSNADKTLVVSVARVNPDGTFAMDPLSKRPFDFLRPPNPIFGKDSPMCQELLGGSSGGQTCPAFQVMIGIRSDGSLNCVPISQTLSGGGCPQHQAISGFNANGTVNCAPPAQSLSVSHAVLVGFNSGCDPNNPPNNYTTTGYIASCFVAVNAWCQSQNFAAGLPTNDNFTNMTAMCVGMP